MTASALDSITTADVLVIDDNPQVREALAVLLTEAGYRVTIAPDGQDGLWRFSQGRFRVVVTDVAMPGLDGWGVARAVRRASPGVGVVLMSAGFDPRDHRAGQPDGVVTLPKPFALEDLIDVIDRIMAPDQDRRAATPRPPRAHRER